MRPAGQGSNGMCHVPCTDSKDSRSTLGILIRAAVGYAVCPSAATLTAGGQWLGGEGQQEIGASRARRTRPGRCIRTKEMKVGVKLFLEMKLTGTADGFDGRDL